MKPSEHRDLARIRLRQADGCANMRTASFFATVAIAHMQMAEMERTWGHRDAPENVETSSE